MSSIVADTGAQAWQIFAPCTKNINKYNNKIK
jgi:hypothetical protein